MRMRDSMCFFQMLRYNKMYVIPKHEVKTLIDSWYDNYKPQINNNELITLNAKAFLLKIYFITESKDPTRNQLSLIVRKYADFLPNGVRQSALEWASDYS